MSVIDIFTPLEFYDIRQMLSGDYQQQNTLDLIDFHANGGWDPIAQNSVGNFSGTYDGQFFPIKNLLINRPSNDYQSLFGRVFGTVRKVVIENPDITARDYVSVLNSGNSAGVNGPTKLHEDCFIKGGILKGRNYVGTLLAFAAFGAGFPSQAESQRWERFYRCGSTCVVEATGDCVGGLFGHYKGPGEDLYYGGEVTGNGNNVGAIFGVQLAPTNTGNPAGILNRLFSIAKVNGYSNRGLGGVKNGTVNNSFWDMDVSEQSTSPAGTGLTTAQAKDITTFINAGFDIGAI